MAYREVARCSTGRQERRDRGANRIKGSVYHGRPHVAERVVAELVQREVMTLVRHGVLNRMRLPADAMRGGGKGQGMSPTSFWWCRRCLASTCTISTLFQLAPNPGVRFRNSFVDGSNEALALPNGDICQKKRKNILVRAAA
jgi:hypothetical protein